MVSEREQKQIVVNIPDILLKIHHSISFFSRLIHNWTKFKYLSQIWCVVEMLCFYGGAPFLKTIW
jgi:hypothetical protein